MFKISREPLKVWWPVTVRMPAEDGTELTFDIRLQYTVPVVLKDVPSGEKVADRIIDWDGIVDEAGSPMPFNAENLEAAMSHEFLSRAAFRGLMEIYNGEHVRKN
jgi:hypothetical protein